MLSTGDEEKTVISIVDDEDNDRSFCLDDLRSTTAATMATVTAVMMMIV